MWLFLQGQCHRLDYYMGFTFFFRDFQTLDLIREYVLPVIGLRRYINIWSAGCATGQEPYTIAILLRENMGPMLFRNVKLLASDIDENNQYGTIIRNGSYPAKELERIPPEIFKRYFSVDPANPENCVIDDEIRKRVEFQQHNLLQLKPVRDDLSLIVCKNVLLHFTEEERINVLKMYYHALNESGFLIVEHTQKMPASLQGHFEQVVPYAQLFRKVNGFK
jgi:chemotaxis protein methyltransferase CheR